MTAATKPGMTGMPEQVGMTTLITEHCAGEAVAVILGSHGFAIGAGAADGDEVAPVTFVEHHALAEYVGLSQTGPTTSYSFSSPSEDRFSMR